MFETAKKVYEKYGMWMMLFPLLILIIACGVLGYNYYTTGDIIDKDVSLKGGILITISSDQSLDLASVESQLADTLNIGVRVTKLSAVGTGGVIGYTFELASGVDKDAAISEVGKIAGIDMKEGEYTVEEISPSLGATFFSSTVKAVAIAFLFMSFVVIVSFRKFIPSVAIIFAGVTDFLGALAIMSLMGVPLSSAGVAALLMILGYSVDTDVLLSTKVLKRGDKGVMEQIYTAIKTGLTMQLATISALTVLYVVAPAGTLKTIALVLMVGVLLDIPNTWIMNAGILRWYAQRKEVKNEQVKITV